MHNPIQVVRPDWNDRYVLWPTRRSNPAAAVLARAAERGALIMPMHFGAPYCGYIRRQGDGLFIRTGGIKWQMSACATSVKERLARGEVASSMTVRLTRSGENRRLAKAAGFDSLYVDLEHSSLSLETTSQICLAALDAGIAPFARVPQLDIIGRVLDGGALGVIVPDVRSAEQARAWCAPRNIDAGERGFAAALPHFQYRNPPAAQAYQVLNDATMVIVQFECAEAVDRADEIVAVEGVDMVLIGTNDLTADMGIPGD